MDEKLSTVFVVDDDEAMRDSLEALLESAGLTVLSFEAATPFLDAYDPSEPGCLALDVHLPDMNGVDVLRRLKAMPADRLTVIVITGAADVQTAVAAMKIGAEDFIEKPFDDEAFIERVETLLEEARTRGQKEDARAAAAGRIDELTPRERDVLLEIVDGHPNKVIAYHLGISPRTVELHRSRVMQKLEARSASQLVRIALESGLVASGDD